MAYTSKTKPSAQYTTGEGRPVLSAANKEPQSIPQQAKFYELEAAEVADIILDENHPDYIKVDDIGSAKLRLMATDFDKPKEFLEWYQYIDTNIKEYPLIGEYVVACTYMGINWYQQTINLMGSINSNCLFHLTDGTKKDHGFDVGVKSGDYEESSAAGSTKDNQEEYKPGDLFINNNLIQPLKPFEGHTMFNGRFGQSIRFGSRARLDDQEGFQDKAGSDPYVSPHILIRTAPLVDAEAHGNDVLDKFEIPGIPIEENINDDGSSIWLTTQEDIPLTPATAESALPVFTSIDKPEAYDGKQVVINSDRIIFNTKLNQFMCFSKGDMYFSTEAKFGIDTVGEILINNQSNIDMKTEKDFLVASLATVNIDGTTSINFGDTTGELLAKGETLLSILQDLIDAIKQSLTPAACVAGPYPVSLTNPAFLDAVAAKLNTILSDRVTTV